VWPARGLSNFISAASILRLCKAVRVLFSDPYKNVGKTKGVVYFQNSFRSHFLKMRTENILKIYNRNKVFKILIVDFVGE